MLHECLGCHWTPAHRDAVPPRCARCCRYAWCRGTRSALQTGHGPCPRSCDAWSLRPAPGSPSAQAQEHRAREGSNCAAWSQTLAAPEQTGCYFIDAGHYFFRCICISSTNSAYLLVGCSLSYSASLSLLPHEVFTQEQVRTAPLLCLCLTLLLQQLLLCLTLLPLFVLVKYMLLALLPLRIRLHGVVHPQLFGCIGRPLFSGQVFIPYSCSILLPWETELFPRYCSPQPL